MAKRLPLSAVLGLQVLVVAAAFIAVILVLSEQQRKEFKDSLYTQLELRQNFVIGSVTSPLFQRMQIFDFAVDSYMAGKKGDGVYARPSDDRTNSQLDDTLPFYEHFYIYAQEDPTFHFISISNQSRRFYAPYNGTDHPTVWNLWALDSSKLLTIYENETADACFGSFPMTITPACFFQFPLNTAVTLGPVVEYGRNMRYLWYGSSIADPTNPEGKAHVLSYTISPKWKPSVVETPADLEDHYIVFSASLSVNHIRPTIVKHLTLPSSRSAVFSKNDNVQYGYSEFLFLSGAVDFTDFDEKVLEETGYALAAAWRAGKTPDEALNKAFIIANAGIDRDASDAYVFEFSSGGRKYVGCAGRFVSLVHDMNWLLLEYTPREDFFGASDRARVTGIVIGAMGGLVVLVVCILIWVAIQVPLRELGASMGLAADMRNDEVVHGDPVLSEIGALNDAFRQMNNKLLAARPFLPQSLLRASNTTDEEEDEEEEDMDFVTSPTRRRVGAHDEDDSSKIPSDYVSVLSELHKGSNTHDMNASSRGAMMKTTDGSISFRSSSVPLARQSRLRDFAFRRVSVLSINVIGFSELLSGNASDKVAGPSGTMTHLARVHTALTKLIETAVGEERGIVDYFHGDRFVCGFNTARVCGNAARNGAECAAKIWDRFLAHGNTNAKNNNELLQAFPHGLAMGLGVGRAAVGNHGTDTMQRLGTIGGPYSEAMRLMDVMSRRVLMGCGGQRGAVSSSSPSARLVVGRCLVMGRVIQELETSKVYCQIVGGVEARELLTSKVGQDRQRTLAFAKLSNENCVKSRLLTQHTVMTTAANEIKASLDTLVLVAAIVSISSVREALNNKERQEVASSLLLEGVGVVHQATSQSHFDTDPLSFEKGIGPHKIAMMNDSSGSATEDVRVQQQQQQHVQNNLLLHNNNNNNNNNSSGSEQDQRMARGTSKGSIQSGGGGGGGGQQHRVGSHRPPNAIAGHVHSPTSTGESPFVGKRESMKNLAASLGKAQGFVNAYASAAAEVAADEWLYELENQQSQNPFTAANVAIARLWNEGFLSPATSVVPPTLEGFVNTIGTDLKLVSKSQSVLSSQQQQAQPPVQQHQQVTNSDSRFAVLGSGAPQYEPYARQVDFKMLRMWIEYVCETLVFGLDGLARLSYR